MKTKYELHITGEFKQNLKVKTKVNKQQQYYSQTILTAS